MTLLHTLQYLMTMYLLLVQVCDENYCDICGDHTMCRYPSSSLADTCRRPEMDPRTYPMTDANRDSIVNLHNQLRQQVARGEGKRGPTGPQYSAKQMPDLVWDQELADVAQRWANQCTWSHDACRNVERWAVGQNIAYQGISIPISDEDASKLINDMIIKWYDEVVNYPRDSVKKFTDTAIDGKDIGHYTQMVWAKTTRVGCGAINYKADDIFYRVFLVCNYGPSGNYLGEPVYEIA